jgi:hypothetical protein
MEANVTYDMGRIRDFLQELGFSKAVLGPQRAYLFQSPALNAGDTGAPIPIKFRTPIIALGIMGQVDTGLDADYATMKMRLQFGTQEDAFDDGYGQGIFAPFLMLFGRFNKPFYDFVRPRFAKGGITYSATFQNTSAGTLTPTAAVRVIELDPESLVKDPGR